MRHSQSQIGLSLYTELNETLRSIFSTRVGMGRYYNPESKRLTIMVSLVDSVPGFMITVPLYVRTYS